MSWLTDLIDEYGREDEDGNLAVPGRTEQAIKRLYDAFADQPQEVMELAVCEYMKEQRFFPRLAELNPYVRTAREQYDAFDRYNGYSEMPFHQVLEMTTWRHDRGPADADETLQERSRLLYKHRLAAVRAMLASWAVCRECGERVHPDYEECPFCIEAAALAEVRLATAAEPLMSEEEIAAAYEQAAAASGAVGVVEQLRQRSRLRHQLLPQRSPQTMLGPAYV